MKKINKIIFLNRKSGRKNSNKKMNGNGKGENWKGRCINIYIDPRCQIEILN